ncbi:mitochondrial import inner membrane translocase subunit Tim21 [Prionailurus iriomotensis]
MICTFLRAVQCAEKLRRSSGKRLFLPHLVLNKACLKTAPTLSWGLREPKKTVRPKCAPAVTQKTIWTQGQSPPRAKEDSSKQVSVHRETGETIVSTSQKVHWWSPDHSHPVQVHKIACSQNVAPIRILFYQYHIPGHRWGQLQAHQQRMRSCRLCSATRDGGLDAASGHWSSSEVPVQSYFLGPLLIAGAVGGICIQEACWECSENTSVKVKEAGRDFTYLVVVLLGIGITGQTRGLFYTIFRELFSSSSPNKIYGKALEKCRSHPELDSGPVRTVEEEAGRPSADIRPRHTVISVFGEPVKGYGEATRRGRRQHVSFIEYVKDGLKHMRVKFYIQGSEPGKQGTVHLEVKENPESGEYEFRYIFVELESFPGRTIVIEDNRS